ncbi:MAG: YihY/virulence factor BrkB family protein [Sphingorhabdus sp.]
MSEHSPLSPEARAHQPIANATEESEASWFAHLDKFHQSFEVIRRVLVGVYSEGFVHAGNFAYLSLVVLFSFCIVAAAIAGAFGQTQSGLALIDAFFQTVPPGVASALRGPVESAMTARSGPLLWFGGAVSLWTTASLIETFRDVLHRAYGTTPHLHFWQYRLGSFATIVLAVLLAMVAFSAQVLLTAIEQLVYRFVPAAQNIAAYFAWGRIVPFLTLFAAIYFVFRSLTPRKYSDPVFPKWPGAALVSFWWLGCTALLPLFLTSVSNYDLTYGSLAGVMVALIFFYLIGLGLVSGAQLNAALANKHENGLRRGQRDSPEE